MQVEDPATLNCPVGHAAAVLVVEPATQKYPAEHRPVQVAAVEPVLDPYWPGLQGPEHAAVGSNGVEP